MTYEVYRYIFIGGAILSVLFLLITLFLFFYLKIPKVIGNLTGATEKKAIKSIRIHNENSGNQIYASIETEKISTQNIPQCADMPETAVLNQYTDETTMLAADIGETAVLEQQQPDIFVIEYEITYIHTDEIVSM